MDYVFCSVCGHKVHSSPTHTCVAIYRTAVIGNASANDESSPTSSQCHRNHNLQNTNYIGLTCKDDFYHCAIFDDIIVFQGN